MVRLVNLQRKEREKGTEIGTVMVLLLFANHVNTQSLSTLFYFYITYACIRNYRALADNLYYYYIY
jgi:hypothetical protein